MMLLFVIATVLFIVAVMSGVLCVVLSLLCAYIGTCMTSTQPRKFESGKQFRKRLDRWEFWYEAAKLSGTISMTFCLTSGGAALAFWIMFELAR